MEQSSASVALNVSSGWGGGADNAILNFGRIAFGVAGQIGYDDPSTLLYIGTTTNHPFAIRTSNTEKVRITTAGNVGIGTSSPEAKLDIKSESVGGSIGMFIENAAASTLNNTADIYFGTWGGSTIAGITNARISAVNVNAGNAESNLDFYTYNGSSSAKRISVTSNGLTFNGDTAAANALDDYEEGTFTPTIAGSGTAGTATYSVQNGRYTKIGRQVSIQIDLAYSSGTGGGNLTITGLPFTESQNVTNPAVTIGFFDAINLTALNYAMAYIASGTTRIDFVQVPTGGGALSSVAYDAGGRIIVNAVYLGS
jgi:hypothetical protein